MKELTRYAWPRENALHLRSFPTHSNMPLPRRGEEACIRPDVNVIDLAEHLHPD